MNKVSNKLSRELLGMDSYIVMLLVNTTNYQNVALDTVKHFSRVEGLPGVYVSVNKPFFSVKRTLIREKVDIETMIFIDAITKISGGNVEQTERCLFLEGPENLTDLSISINEAISALDFKQKFLFFDSINTLLVYNDSDNVSKFFHFLTGRLRQWNVKGAIIALDKKTDKGIIAQIGQFCDKVIDMT